MKLTQETNALPEILPLESVCLEYKENLQSKTYLKTVSAFCNYLDGEIKFGITDDRQISGIENPESAALALENQINDNIIPQPRYTISIDTTSNVIILSVKKGKNVPYRYKGKAYRRNGSSTIEVDDYELNQLILEGKNLEYCDLVSDIQELSFNTFSSIWNSIYTLPVNNDLLATLGCYNADGYSITAELLSDQNHFPGVSLVQFGDSINQIELRKSFENQSILKTLDDVIELITDLLSYEEVSGLYRKLQSKLPILALRESLINALVHRDWSIPAPVQIEIFADKLTILSPGGLPKSMSEEEYLYSNRSIPRNTALTIIFLRLYLIEKLGTGLRRIRSAYESMICQPEFRVFPNSILVTLPFTNLQATLTDDQAMLLNVLQQNSPLKRKDFEKLTGFSQSKVTRILNQLISLNLIRKINSGPQTQYTSL